MNKEGRCDIARRADDGRTGLDLWLRVTADSIHLLQCRLSRLVAFLGPFHDERAHPRLVPKSPPPIRQKNHPCLSLVRRRTPTLFRRRGSSHIAIVSTSGNRPKPVHTRAQWRDERRHRKAGSSDARHARTAPDRGTLGIRVEMGWPKGNSHNRFHACGSMVAQRQQHQRIIPRDRRCTPFCARSPRNCPRR